MSKSNRINPAGNVIQLIERLRLSEKFPVNTAELYESCVPLRRDLTPLQDVNMELMFIRSPIIHFTLETRSAFWVWYGADLPCPRQNAALLVGEDSQWRPLYDWHARASEIDRKLSAATDAVTSALSKIALSYHITLPAAVPEIPWGLPFRHSPDSERAEVRRAVLRAMETHIRFSELQELCAAAQLMPNDPCYAWVGWRSAPVK